MLGTKISIFILFVLWFLALAQKFLLQLGQHFQTATSYNIYHLCTQVDLKGKTVLRFDNLSLAEYLSVGINVFLFPVIPISIT